MALQKGFEGILVRSAPSHRTDSSRHQLCQSPSCCPSHADGPGGLRHSGCSNRRLAGVATATTALAHTPPGMPCPTTPGHLLATGEGIAVGSGPVYAVLGQSSSTGADERQRHGVLQYADAHAYGKGTSGWGGVKVLWVIGASYTGSVLIRGHQLDGSHEVRFNGGLDQLFLEYANDLAAVPPLPGLRLVRVSTDTGWTDWPSETRLQAPGCYAYQVNGLTFSEVIVFQAVLVQHP